ncbi:unnamed protein product [Effrenium voratum]|uniref:Uncharacterized protein n=1 Tax=Effrenium voratum TaxID=2562239 RepID=A0AA36J7M2_9DINO|nr:unnamed protein product [Effrenium voratum]CAJ1416237.1 unnamed protein product [Effrenium voratum]
MGRQLRHDHKWRCILLASALTFSCPCFSRIPRAADFESGLSLEDMLQLAEKRKSAPAPVAPVAPVAPAAPAAPVALVAEVEETAPQVLIPEVLDRTPSFFRLEVAAELPCVFTPSEEGERRLGDEVKLRFWQDRYIQLWDHACRRTDGAVAVRFSKGSLRRSPHAFALWPAKRGDSDMLGLNLGMFNVSVATVNPFPMLRLLYWPDIDEAAAKDPAELNSFLRSLGDLEAQKDAIRGMSPADRLALIRWLAKGGD